jgi:hypothetical protein
VTGSVFWQGVFPWLAALVGGGLASLFSWLSAWTRFRGALAFQVVPGKDPRVAEAEARAKLEGLGTFEPQFRISLWQASVQPLFLFALLFPLGKQLSTDGPQLACCVLMAVLALVISLLHEFRWKEHVPVRETAGRPILVVVLWLLMLGLAIWVAAAPAQAKTATAAPRGSSSAEIR